MKMLKNVLLLTLLTGASLQSLPGKWDSRHMFHSLKEKIWHITDHISHTHWDTKNTKITKKYLKKKARVLLNGATTLFCMPVRYARKMIYKTKSLSPEQHALGIGFSSLPYITAYAAYTLYSCVCLSIASKLLLASPLILGFGAACDIAGKASGSEHTTPYEIFQEAFYGIPD